MSRPNALAERNARVKYARTLGVTKPHTLKSEALEAAITEAEQAMPVTKEVDADPFDEINPEVEGDHLTEDVLNDTITDKLHEREATREAWLISALEMIKPLLAQHGAATLKNRDIRVSVGFPSKSVRKVIGQCHYAAHNEGVTHIFVSPVKDDAVDVLGILTHETIHAEDQGESGHNGRFKQLFHAVGMTGKTTACEIGAELRTVFESMISELGPYPHTKLNLGGPGVKKQTTRMLKGVCGEIDGPCPLTDEKGGKYTVRLTAKWIEVGMPSCPCGSEMIVEEKGEQGE